MPRQQIQVSQRSILGFISSRRYGDLRRTADEDLMQLVRDGEARAFEIVFDRHADAAFSLAYRMCGSRTRAEDVVQEAFLSLWRTGARYDSDRGSVRSWILGVVHNRAIDAFRHASARIAPELDSDVADQMPSAEWTTDEVERRDEAQHVRSALGELPSDQRHVIELAYFGGFTHTEIARMLELPTGTVKGRMRLGLAKLRVSLNGMGYA